MNRMITLLGLLAGLLAAPAAPQAQTSFNQRAVVSTATSGDQTLVAAVTGKQILVYGLDLYAASSLVVTLKCGSTAVTGAMTMTVYQKPISPGAPYWVCPASTALVATLGTSVQLSGAVWYTQQ